MFDIILKVFESVDSPESIASIICSALVPVITAIAYAIKKKIKPGSKEERMFGMACKFIKDMWGQRPIEDKEECNKKPHTTHKSKEHKEHKEPKDGKKT